MCIQHIHIHFVYLLWILTSTLTVNRFHSNNVYALRDIIIYHLTLLWFFFNVVFLTTFFPFSIRFVNITDFHSDHLHRLSVTRLVRMYQGRERSFNNLRLVSYFSRNVIIIIYFSLNVISKKYFSWTVMRLLSSNHLCVSINACKQTSPGKPEVICTRRTLMDFLQKTFLIWVFSLGVKLWIVYFSSRYTYAKTIILMPTIS